MRDLIMGCIWAAPSFSMIVGGAYLLNRGRYPSLHQTIGVTLCGWVLFNAGVGVGLFSAAHLTRGFQWLMS